MKKLSICLFLLVFVNTFNVYGQISDSSDYNIPPYVVPLFTIYSADKGTGLLSNAALVDSENGLFVTGASALNSGKESWIYLNDKWYLVLAPKTWTTAPTGIALVKAADDSVMKMLPQAATLAEPPIWGSTTPVFIKGFVAKKSELRKMSPPVPHSTICWIINIIYGIPPYQDQLLMFLMARELSGNVPGSPILNKSNELVAVSLWSNKNGIFAAPSIEIEDLLEKVRADLGTETIVDSDNQKTSR